MFILGLGAGLGWVWVRVRCGEVGVGWGGGVVYPVQNRVTALYSTQYFYACAVS
jgi:hypothetical protein